METVDRHAFEPTLSLLHGDKVGQLNREMLTLARNNNRQAGKSALVRALSMSSLARMSTCDEQSQRIRRREVWFNTRQHVQHTTSAQMSRIMNEKGLIAFERLSFVVCYARSLFPHVRKYGHAGVEW